MSDIPSNTDLVYADEWKRELFKRDEQYQRSDLLHLFLPHDVTTLVMKIATLHNLTPFSEFSILDSLQYGLTHCRNLLEDCLNKKKITMLIINIIRICEKMNDRESIIGHSAPSNILQVLGISNEELNDFELQVFRSMEFKVIPPITLELVQHFVTTCAFPFINDSDYIYKIAVDVLRSIYLLRDLIYDRYLNNVLTTIHWSIRQDRLLLAASCLVSTLMVLHIPPEINNKVMELLINECKRPWNNLMRMGEIIVDSLIEK